MQLEEDLNDDPTRGMSVEVTKTPNGDYQLRMSVADHPTLIFNGKLSGAKVAKKWEFVNPTPKCVTVARKHATKGDATSPMVITLTFHLSKKHHEMILVAGWDYSGGADKTQYAKTFRDDVYRGETHIVKSVSSVTKNQTIAKEIFTATVVTLFDFKSGNRVRWWKGQKKWHEIDEVLQGSVATDTSKPYDDATTKQKRHDDDAISITHVYDYIIALGKAVPGCVAGFHIFSHAWDGGPVLVNTDQASPYGYAEPRADDRDPDDKDGRDFDFESQNMPDVSHFKAAFQSGATLKIWGCLAVTKYRKMARVALKETETGRDKNEQFTFTADSQTLTMSIQEIEDEFNNNILGDSYMQNLADAVGQTVFGAPPGAGSNLKSVGRKNYMYVDQLIYSKVLKWYETALGKSHDKTGYVPHS